MALERVAVRPIEHGRLAPTSGRYRAFLHPDAQHFYDHSMSRDPKAEGYKPAKREEIPGPNRRLVEAGRQVQPGSRRLLGERT